MIGDDELQKELRRLKLIWFAILISLPVYLFVALQVAKEVQTSLDADTFQTLRSALYIVALITLVITRYVKKLLLSGKGIIERAAQDVRYSAQHPAVRKYAIAMLVSWAMSETIGIYGFVLFLMGKNAMDLYLLILVSAAAMFTFLPNKDEIVRLIGQKVS